MPRLSFGSWVEDAVDWLQSNLTWIFDFIKTVLGGMYDGVNAVLGGGEPLLMAGIFAVIAFWLRGVIPAVATFVGFALIDSLALWDLLLELGYEVDGLYLGLGIGEYSDESGDYVRAFAEGRGLRLIEVDLRDQYGYDIPTTYATGRMVLVGTAVLTVLTWLIAIIVWA